METLRTRKKQTWGRVVSAFSGLLAIAMLLVACQPSGSSAPSQPTETTSERLDTVTGTVPGDDDLVPGSSIVVAVTQEPDFLDPYLAEAAGTKEILYNIFDGLLRLEPDGTFSAALASAWSMADDALSYRFELREGVRFHNGKALEPSDVVYSLSRAAGIGEDKPLISQLAILDSVRAEGQTIICTLKQADPDLTAFFTTAILPEGYDEQRAHPVGTGPYRFVSYEPQQRLVLEANTDGWHAEGAAVERVEFRIVPSADSAILDLQAGRIDVFPYLTPDNTQGLEGRYELIEARSNMVQLLALNNARPPLDKREVREALRLAIDKQQIIDLVVGGYGTPLTSAMSEAMGAAWNGDVKDGDAAPDPKGDRERARTLLAEAGLGDGFELRITVPSNYVVHVRTAEVISRQLAEVGIRVQVDSVDWGTWLSQVYAGRDYDATIIALTFVYSPIDVLDRYVSTADNNFINYKSEAFDTAFAELSQTVEQGRRIELLHQLQQTLFDDSASVFIQDPALLTAVHKRLSGYTTYPEYVQDIARLRLVDTE